MGAARWSWPRDSDMHGAPRAYSRLLINPEILYNFLGVTVVAQHLTPRKVPQHATLNQ
jgi:hypothetical protein